MTCSSRVMKDLRKGKKKPLDKTSLDCLAILGYLFDHLYVLYLFFRNISFVFIFLVYWIMYTYFFSLIFVLCNFENLFCFRPFCLCDMPGIFFSDSNYSRMYWQMGTSSAQSGLVCRFFFIVAFKNNDLGYQINKIIYKNTILNSFCLLSTTFPLSTKTTLYFNFSK